MAVISVFVETNSSNYSAIIAKARTAPKDSDAAVTPDTAGASVVDVVGSVDSPFSGDSVLGVFVWVTVGNFVGIAVGVLDGAVVGELLGESEGGADDSGKAAYVGDSDGNVVAFVEVGCSVVALATVPFAVVSPITGKIDGDCEGEAVG